MEEQLGALLCERGVITPAQLEQALKAQAARDPRPSLAGIVRTMFEVEEGALVAAEAEQMGMPVWDLEASPPDPALKELIPAQVAMQCRIVAQGRENGAVRCVVCGPLAPEDRARIEFMVDQPIRLALAPEAELAEHLEELYGMTVENMIQGLAREQEQAGDEVEAPMHDLREMAQEPTLINLVNMIISDAIDERASDIHIEPFETDLSVRCRIDGILHEMAPPPKRFQSAIVSRVKIMAGLDIAERYVPQDGQIRVTHKGDQVDIRVSTVPTIYGESVVMRLLKRDSFSIDLTRLGLQAVTQRRLEQLLELPHGIILTCGPTGSGKTTTLYACLKQIFSPALKIITIEDPVEYKIHGINQIPVRPKRGLTFATGLRAIVRQDPDVIMVGEIRDRETADIAIRSALTGHLVFSTLHTNDAPGGITRLLDMGAEPFLVASSIQGLLGQRLVRRLCPACRRKAAPEPALVEQFGVGELPEFIYEAEGCEACHGRGFLGRVGVFELLSMDDQLHELVLKEASSTEIKRTARRLMQTMREDGWLKVLAGMTTAAEVLHATQYDVG